MLRFFWEKIVGSEGNQQPKGSSPKFTTHEVAAWHTQVTKNKYKGNFGYELSGFSLLLGKKLYEASSSADEAVRDNIVLAAEYALMRSEFHLFNSLEQQGKIFLQFRAAFFYSPKFQTLLINLSERPESISQNSISRFLQNLFNDTIDKMNQLSFPDIPNHYLCPISQSLMMQPMYDSGQTEGVAARFDLYFIEEHLKRNQINPCTGQPLKGKLIRDEALHLEIARFKEAFRPIEPSLSHQLR